MTETPPKARAARRSRCGFETTALELDRDRVTVTLEQKARGGITITATA